MALRGELDRIADQIGQDLPNPMRIPDDPAWGLGPAFWLPLDVKRIER